MPPPLVMYKNATFWSYAIVAIMNMCFDVSNFKFDYVFRLSCRCQLPRKYRFIYAACLVLPASLVLPFIVFINNTLMSIVRRNTINLTSSFLCFQSKNIKNVSPLIFRTIYPHTYILYMHILQQIN